MEIEIGIEFKQRSIIATLRWGREGEWDARGVSGSKCKMRQTKRFTYTRALPAAATWVEPRGASHRHRHRRLARFDALISYLVCCLYLFCRLGERMHPSRMKSCCQQGASDCKLCKLRVVPTVSANCLPTSICVLASGNATTRKSVVVVVVFSCVCISSSSYPPTLSIYLYIHLSIYVSVKL